MQLERFSDAAAVARRAADLVSATVRARPEAVLLLPAGATPVPLYAELVRRARAGALELARTRLFQLDELIGVAPADARSFQAFLRAHLVEPLGLAHAFHGLDGGAREPEREIERHARALGALGVPDLALLGLGKNGHVAFNEPGAPPGARARQVELEARTRAELACAFPEGAPARGLTLGLAEIDAARRVVLLVTGAGKAEVLARARATPGDPSCPASLLAAHAGLVVLADEAAAGGPTRASS
jgi:glucosamine-6-phosphate deaminase